MDRKEIILRSIMGQVCYFGYTKTTIKGIAQAAGMSVATLYYYFPDRTTALLIAFRKEHVEYYNDLSRLLKFDHMSVALFKEIVSARLNFVMSCFRYDYICHTKMTSVNALISQWVKAAKYKEQVVFGGILSSLMLSPKNEACFFFQQAGLLIKGLDDVAGCSREREISAILRRQHSFLVEFIERAEYGHQ
ncbi:TetR/AcrR family transcriptional regulator [Arcticibacter tournemirensis]|uniref:TetR/AcrR family transcriptional regulator n=1 Tax=Arcticibacter tournemirensis TaxID=699437 RepID=A0A4Q0M757_9SPHI|nr:helix-turn-helix domain-containing protein [Arcticibacter tournemirensis]RXF68599.1 TetR/AcrR family transcriptional regulator [Arcticibacter tournemirensis]